jgi:formylmethanofuran dehydrogenase subunit B
VIPVIIMVRIPVIEIEIDGTITKMDAVTIEKMSGRMKENLKEVTTAEILGRVIKEMLKLTIGMMIEI